MSRFQGCAWLLVLAGWCGAVGCATEPDTTGGETHFLRVCDSDPSACGTALSCLCGVCTVACQVEASCAAFAGAECSSRSNETCAGSVQGNVCDVSCDADGDCTALSAEHRCMGGSCRLVPDDPMGGEGGDGNVTPPDTCTTGTTSANEVLIVGDSFFATSHHITAYLEDLARNAGTIATGERYRDV